ncbi:hypothetical protein DPSP01_013153 [Paraphaeosphaeria sporulosa]|uniref:Ubiquitin 3 binding protein But2 C-terminal domain-containing protein n=1 Tax=Paraphaeosphaeria sporulosa TaxID=1460663 RepID=A0A177C328_9PLEO|nr:uncharacterized protein CC84DRAFT_1208491 [Paraphaeosphaeria sporulosa]OAG01292.1 hypothetical protein CC84DRAFT_1208491 [Paraphaeosphaeria sporulosa]
MKITAILSAGVATIGIVLAAPAVQYDEAPSSFEALAGSGDKWALHANSVSGNPRMFKSRPIVALGEGTIDGVPQNHAPPTQVHLPPSFGLENFTAHPQSTPVTFTLTHVGGQNGTRYSLTNVTLTNESWKTANFATEYIFYEPNNIIAIGWYTLFNQPCPKRVGCDPLGWDIRAEGNQKLLKPADQTGGAWDAVKTKEGRGWRVVWKSNVATVHNEVRISVVPFDK